MRDLLIFLPLTVFYLAFKSTMLPSTPVPDLPLIIVFYLAYRKSSVEGALLGFVLGYIDDVFSGATLGTSSFSLVFVFAVVHLLAKKMHFSTTAVKVLGATLMVLLKGALIYIIMSFTKIDVPFLSHVFANALITGIFAPVIISFLNWLVQITAPRTARVKSNDELL